MPINWEIAALLKLVDKAGGVIQFSAAELAEVSERKELTTYLSYDDKMLVITSQKRRQI